VRRVLVANRGEIAQRVIRGCREEGLEAVAVYSEADARSPHLRGADRAEPIGRSAPSESYLNIGHILDAARRSGADAVHPGYGFLAESAEFADAVASSGLTWIGPPASAIAAMGDKTSARKRMREHAVPVVPGSLEPAGTLEDAARAAKSVRYPVLLKAAAGGGGRGMRAVAGPDELPNAFFSARSEALASFGDGRVYLERLLVRPRHVEIQILADQHGRVIHLGERECSVQRRHQKLIEEAPSPAVTPALRRMLGDAAIRSAQSVGYVSVGTVEFLVMPDGQFYFLEMNTRLQVEHPVTEMVYGVDLVRMQLKVAMGHHVSLPDRALIPRGWSMECRITAEDPFQEFLPAAGRLEHVRIPEGPGVRWDGWIETGAEVPPQYDSLLGKLVVWGESRDRAIKRMKRCLNDLVIVGVPTSREFHLRVMDEPEFARGAIDIEYWHRLGRPLMSRAADPSVVEEAAVAAALLEHERRSGGGGAERGPRGSGGTGGRGGSGGSASPWADTARREGLRE
jgi:acetyl-CoA carboxylase biotin carboxylase subunit